MEGLKLQTPVETGRSAVSISLKDRIFVLGSCFADNIGGKMVDLGFDVCVNPFGTIYNPVSVCNSIARLTSGIPFTEDECVPMGAGSHLLVQPPHLLRPPHRRRVPVRRQRLSGGGLTPVEGRHKGHHNPRHGLDL